VSGIERVVPVVLVIVFVLIGCITWLLLRFYR
jgi:hypothetical protein